MRILISKLLPANRGEAEIEQVIHFFSPILRNCGGELFRLNNDDLFVILLSGASNELMDQIVHHIALVFRDDPYIARGRGEGIHLFCTWYDMEEQYDLFRQVIREMRDGRNEANAGRSIGLNNDPETMDQQFVYEDASSDETTTNVETALGETPLHLLIARQLIYASVPKVVPQKVIEEVFVAPTALDQYFLPGVGRDRNERMFAHMAHVADQRVLEALINVFALQSAFMFRCGVETLTSAAMIAFDQAWRAAGYDQREMRLTFSVPAADADENRHDYEFGRDYLRAQGYRICVTDIPIGMLGGTDLRIYGADLIGVAWSQNMATDFSDWVERDCQEAIGEVGAHQVFLTGCNTAEAVEIGRRIGLTLFQGPFMERLDPRI